MEEEQIKEMLSDIVSAIDYDIWKDIFEFPEDPEFAEDLIDELTTIVHHHLNQE